MEYIYISVIRISYRDKFWLRFDLRKLRMKIDTTITKSVKLNKQTKTSDSTKAKQNKSINIIFIKCKIDLTLKWTKKKKKIKTLRIKQK